MAIGIFDGFRLLVIESDTLQSGEVDRIKQLLSQNTKEPIEKLIEVRKASDPLIENEQILNKFTHVISNTTDFPNFRMASDTLMMPVLISQWVIDSATHGKLESVRSYAADTRLIFNGCVITCSSSVCEGDKMVIAAATRAFGGIYIQGITRNLTHLITTNPSDDVCSIVGDYNRHLGKTAIETVAPEWLFASISNAKRLKEDQFALDWDKTNLKDIDVSDKQRFLEKKTFFLSNDYGCSERLFTALKYAVKSISGAQIINDRERLNTAGSVLCLYRCGPVYEEAFKNESTEVGNVEWLFWMLLNKKWISPLDKLLHYPFQKGSVKGMENVIASATNYAGDARMYLQRLIELMGGKFTKTLKAQNTHLLVAKSFGRKYEAAGRWNIKRVNHIWLEESYAKWIKMPDTDPKYTAFPRDSNDVAVIGTTRLEIPNGRKNKKEEAPIISNNSRKTHENIEEKRIKASSVETKQLIEAQQNHEKTIASNDDGIKENSRNDDSNVRSEDEKVLKHTGSADKTALETQPGDIETGNKDTKQSESQLSANGESPEISVFDIPQVSADESINISSSPVVKRKAETPTKEGSTRKKAKHDTDGKSYNIIAVMTGSDLDLTTADTKKLHKVGITILKAPRKDLNCIIAPTVLRTEKFLKALSMSPRYIISPLFVSDVLGTLDMCHRVTDFDAVKPDINVYQLGHLIRFDKDRKAKSLFVNSKLGPVHAIQNLIDNSTNTLFTGFNFNVSADTNGVQTITEILKMFGAQNCQTVDIKTKSFIKCGKDSPHEGAYILMCTPKEKALIKYFKSTICIDGRKPKFLIAQWNWAVWCIFNTFLEKDKYIIENHL